jgi:hypothetical protein
LGTPARLGGGKQSYQRLAQHTPQVTPQTPHTHQAAPTSTPARPAGQGTTTVTTCFKCGEVGHYANTCPKRNPNTPARSNVQGKQQTPATGKGFGITRVNQVSADGTDISIGTFFINSVLVAILFDSGATYSFIFARYVNTNELPLQTMQKPMIVITPKGPIEANYMTNRLTLTIMGREFWSMPIVLEESGIDLILGMSWLRKAKAVVHCARGTVELTSPKGERFEVMITLAPSTKPAIYLVDGKFVGRHTHGVREFLDVFPEELPKMPPDREVEFVIDLLPGTAPISKRPYIISIEELKEIKKQLIELQEAGYICPSFSPWGAPVLFVQKKNGS